MANRTGTYVAFDGLGQTDPTKSDFRYYSTIHDDDLQPAAGGLGEAGRRRTRGHGHPRPLPASYGGHHHHRQKLSITKQNSEGARPKVGAENRGRLHGTVSMRYTNDTNPGRF